MNDNPFISDLSGKKFNYLTVMSITNERTASGSVKWLCICDCGRECVVVGTRLKSGLTRSCGCYQREALLKSITTHGQSDTPEYKVWSAIKQRCYNPNCEEYHNYGARGISMCDRWLNSFENFLADVGFRPSEELSLDRKDNDGIYEPANCRWAVGEVQQSNKRNNRWIEYDGKTMILGAWARYIGLRSGTLYKYLKKMTMGEIISKYKNSSN